MHPIKSHLPKTEVLTVVSKMAIFIQIVIFDIGEIFGHRKLQFQYGTDLFAYFIW